MSYKAGQHINYSRHKDGSVTFDDHYGPNTKPVRCSRCKGSGQVIRYGIGLTLGGNVPAASMMTCPDCGGDGKLHERTPLNKPEAVKIKNPDDWQEFSVPDSFIMRWWKNRKK